VSPHASAAGSSRPASACARTFPGPRGTRPRPATELRPPHARAAGADPGQAGESGGVPAEHIHVMAHERGEASDVPLAQSGRRGPGRHAGLVLHAVVLVPAELRGPAAEDLPGQGVAALLQAGLPLELPAVARFAGQAQDVQGLGDPLVVGDGISSRSPSNRMKNRSSSERGGYPAACSSVRTRPAPRTSKQSINTTAEGSGTTEPRSTPSP